MFKESLAESFAKSQGKQTTDEESIGTGTFA
jgi:hypothetical protein